MAPFGSCPASLLSRKFFAVGPGCAKCFFLLRSVGRRDLRRGQSKKKKKNTTQVFFFAPAPGKGKRGQKHGASPSPAFPRGRSKKKKNTLGGVFFFFAAAPRGRSLTHCGPGWRCLPLAGVVFVFFAAAPPGPGWCFFFLLWPRPDAHSLTVGWGDFGKARVVFLFLLRPRRVFLDNKKNVWGTTSGLKRPGRATAKTKNTTS